LRPLNQQIYPIQLHLQNELEGKEERCPWTQHIYPIPSSNYTGLGRVKGNDNFELDLLEHNNPTLDEESDNNPTLDEESASNPTLDEESTNPTLDEEPTFFLTRIKKSIRRYIGFCRMPKCLMMFIGSLALIARVISLGITRLIGTLTLISTVHYLNLMRFGSRLFTHLLYLISDSVSDSDIPSFCYSEQSEAILIMGILGLTNHESEFTLESLQVDDLQKLVLVLDQAFMNALLRSGIIRERALQLRYGFAAFSAYYQSQNKEKVVRIGNCGDVLTFENVFDSHVYNATFHRRHLQQFCGKDRPNPANFNLSIPIQEGSNVSPLKLTSGFKLKELRHQLNVCEKENSSSFLESDFPVNNIRTFNERNMEIP